MNSRIFAVGVLTIFALSAGCVRRTIPQDFGLSGINAPRAKRPAPPPDAGLRATFKKQTITSFNPVIPVTDAQRVQTLVERVNANPQDVSAWNELGLLYERANDLAASQRAFQEALGLNPESDRVHNNLGYNLLLQNDLRTAEAEFRRALELNPALATARNNLGTLLARRGDIQAALEQFEMVADSATAHNNLAVVLLETGHYEKSREELVKALALRRSFAPALANFKLVQQRIRERAELERFPRLPLSAVRVNTLRTRNENILETLLERN